MTNPKNDMEKSNTLYAIPASTPPIKSGRYYTSSGELYYSGKRWDKWSSVHDDTQDYNPEYWYSEIPPPELKEVIDKIKQDQAIHKRMGHARVHVEFTHEEANVLLKHL